MKGYKDTTRTVYTKGGPSGTKGAAKVATVMREFKNGTLHSGSGVKVTNPRQALAISLSEARKRR